MIRSSFDDIRKTENAKALAAFALDESTPASTLGGTLRTIRTGSTASIFTIGYEKRSGEDLMNALIDAGVRTLVDVRQRAFSRKPDFRSKALQAHCAAFSIKYVAFPELGSTDELRDELKSSGNLSAFHQDFRKYAQKNLTLDLERLATIVQVEPVALMCYERAHEECHRSVIASLVAEKVDASIIAIT